MEVVLERAVAVGREAVMVVAMEEEVMEAAAVEETEVEEMEVVMVAVVMVGAVMVGARAVVQVVAAMVVVAMVAEEAGEVMAVVKAAEAMVGGDEEEVERATASRVVEVMVAMEVVAMAVVRVAVVMGVATAVSEDEAKRALVVEGKGQYLVGWEMVAAVVGS